MSKTEIKPCPFCGAELKHETHVCRAKPKRPTMHYYRHEKTGCIMDGYELVQSDLRD